MGSPVQVKTEIVQLGDLSLTITEAGFIENSVRYQVEREGRERNQKEIDEALANKTPLTRRQLIEQYYRVEVYPLLAACVVNDECLPSCDEFLHMPPEYRQKWYEVTRRLNPDYFAKIDSVAKQADEAQTMTLEERKKKEKKPRS